MALIKELPDKIPHIADGVFLAETATIIGQVEIGKDSSIWYGAVLRGDVNFIKVGQNTNIQDNVTVHATYKKFPTIIGNKVSIGHNAVIHACTIEDNVLVGMGAIIMDNAHIGANSIIAAGAVVLPGTVVEPFSLYAGIPAKKVKSLSKDHVQSTILSTAERYKLYTTWYNQKKH